MIIRIVKMTFKAEEVESFKTFFENYKDQIRNFPGCQYLQVLQDNNRPEIIFSYSYWDTEADLNNYRNSELFSEIWPKTKAKFAAKAEAWSTHLLHDLK
jgi:heme-degrading monooxygenase HmoA